METSSVFIVKKDDRPFDWESGAITAQKLDFDDFSPVARELIGVDNNDTENLQKIRDFISDMLIHFSERVENPKSAAYESFQKFPLPTLYPAFSYTDTGKDGVMDICYSMFLCIKDSHKILDAIGIKDILDI